MSEDLRKLLFKINLFNKKILKPFIVIALGIGFNVGQRTGFKDPLKLINLSLIMVSMFSLTCQSYYIWEHRTEPMIVYMDSICTSLQTGISIFKLHHFALAQRQFQDMLYTAQSGDILQKSNIFELNIRNKREIMEDIHKILYDSWEDIRLQLKVFISSVIVVSCWYSLSCLAINVYYMYINPQDFDVLYPLHASYPMWDDKGMEFPYYFILYLLNILPIHMAAISSISFAGIYIIGCIHGLALLRILRRLINNVTTDNISETDRSKYMMAWCRLHQHIYDYCYQINSLYYIHIAPMFLVSMLVVCLLIFQASIGLGTDYNMFVKMFLYLTAAVSEISIFCINGQRLTSESEWLPIALYNCKWYDETAEFKFLIRIILMRTYRPIEIEMGGFTTMSFVTLFSILRSSCSYFLLLRKVND